MTLFDLILIAVSLSMDAFAVSICKGLSVRRVSPHQSVVGATDSFPRGGSLLFKISHF